MPPSRDSFRRNRVAPVDTSILPLLASGRSSRNRRPRSGFPAAAHGFAALPIEFRSAINSGEVSAFAALRFSRKMLE